LPGEYLIIMPFTPVYAYSDYGCWQWHPGRYGYVRVWVC
jgi:hypothetical protein